MAATSTSNSTASQRDNLDLTDIPSDQPDELAGAIETFYKTDSQLKAQLAYHWERTHLMLDGSQWLVYEGSRVTGGMWKPIKVSKENEYIPRPVTNYMFDAYQTLKSYMLKNKPRSTIRPNTQTHKDKSAAKIGQLVLEANYEKLRDAANYEYAASCLIAYGTVFKKDYWDVTNLVTAHLPRMETRPKIDPATGQVVGEEQVPAIDPATGEPLFDDVPLGDVNTGVIEPYRVALDPLCSDVHNTRWIMEYAIQPIDWIVSTYGRTEEGYTGRAEEVKAESTLNTSMRRWYQLKTTSGTRPGQGPMNSAGAGGSDQMVINAAVVKEYYERPSNLYPKGRLIVVANGVPLYVGDSPYSGDQLGDWHPYSECRWELVPGRFWGKGPLDDGAEIQKMINSIDAVIILTRKTMAIPQKLIPLGIGVEPGRWTGRPGAETFYRDNGSGLKPETIPAAGVDESVFMERKERVQDFKNITGAIDILKGDRPPGVTAASALNMLYEVGTGKLFPMLDRWKSFIESSQKKQLTLVSKRYREPRADFIRLLKSRNQDLSDQEINAFIGADLLDNCNVIIEAGSNIPKLQAAEQAMLMEVAATGAIDLSLPANRSEFLQRLGMTGFDNDVGPDTKRAEWEDDLLDNLQITPDNQPVVLEVDNHEIHIDCHSRRMKAPSFMSLPTEVQQAYLQHIEEHKQYMAMAQQQMMMEQGAMAMAGMQSQPPGGPGGQPQGQPGQSGAGASAPTKLHEAGKGTTTAVKNNVFGDAITPGSRK